ncbi:MAG: DUF2723 domain-containing protein [Armatimonadetes bacterium]|nr:DUF2723 domain-containing protein [Armatimonadota bacterium]
MSEAIAIKEGSSTSPVPRRGFPERHYPAAALLFALSFAFYAATMAPNLMPGDTGDMVQAAASLREAHPPGYPLYGMIGKLFVALPVGDIPYRMNLMAAFLGGLAVAFVFLAALLLTRHAAAALATALLFGLNYLFWTYFALAETFCLNNFLLALIAFLALLWRERRRQAPGGTVERQTLVLLAFLAGLSLGNHHTMVLTFPGLLALVAATEQRDPRPAWRVPLLFAWLALAGALAWVGIGALIPRPFLLAGAALLVAAFVALADRKALAPARLLALCAWFGLGVVLPYLYLAVAGMVNTDHYWEDPTTLQGLLRLFTRAKYGSFQLAPGKGTAVTPSAQALSYFGALAAQYLWAGFLLGVLGAVLAAFRDRSFLLYAGGGFLFGCTFILRANIDPKPTAYDAATLERFYQLPNFFFVLFIGFALGAIAESVATAVRRQEAGGRRQEAGGRRQRAGGLLAACFLTLPLLLGIQNYPKANLRGNWLYPRFIYNILDTLPPNAILLTWTDTVGMGADYLMDVEKRRPDVAHMLVGVLFTEPYNATVRRRYPDLFWPRLEEGPGSRSRFLGRFLDENLKTRRVFFDGLGITIKFPVTRYGLLYEVRPAGSKPTIREVEALNEDLWRRYDLRQVDTTLYPANSMCYSVVVFYYLQQRFMLGTEYNAFGMHRDALRHLRACVPMDRYGYVARSSAWHRQMGIAYVGLNEADQAIAHLQVAQKEAPEEPLTYDILSRAYRLKGDERQAERFAAEHAARQKAWDARTKK